MAHKDEPESKETFLSDFGKLYSGLSKEAREAALKEVGQMQKEGLIKVSTKTENMITKEQALQIYFDHEKDRIKITDETPLAPIYKTSAFHEDCWYVYPPAPLAIGASRVVVISKVDGQILFDGDIGE